MIDPTDAAARLERARYALLVARSEFETAEIALGDVNAINGFVESVADCIRRIVDGYSAAQHRRLDAMLAEFEPVEWPEQVSNFVPERQYDWLSGKTIVGNHWIMSRFNRLRRPPSESSTLWGFAAELIKHLPKDTSLPPVILRRPDAFSIEIAFAAIDGSVSTTP